MHKDNWQEIAKRSASKMSVLSLELGLYVRTCVVQYFKRKIVKTIVKSEMFKKC